MGDTTVVDTDSDTPPTVTDTATATTARGPLRPSPATDTTAEGTDTEDTDTEDSDVATTTARGPLMPSRLLRIRPRLRLRILRMKWLKKFMFFNQIRVQSK